MQVKLPPIKMISIEREIIIFSTITGVRQNVASTFGEAKKDVPENKKIKVLVSYMLHNEQYKITTITHQTSSESANSFFF